MKKDLQKIMYDQTQFTSVWMIDSHGIWINDEIQAGMKRISGYAPETYITYTQNNPTSFFFGAYDEEALKKEAEVGFQNFIDPKFLEEFEFATQVVYEKTKAISKEYFSTFYEKEKEVLDSDPLQIVAFIKKVHEMTIFLMSYYLLTQPQRFSLFDEKLKSFLPNADLELVSTTGKYLTYISRIQKSIVDVAQEISEKNLTLGVYLQENSASSSHLSETIQELGFLNWGLLGGELIDIKYAKREIEKLLQDKSKLDQEVGKMNDLIRNIAKRNAFLYGSQDESKNIADIMGHASVLRFDLQTCMLCLVKYIDNFIKLAQQKYNLSDVNITSYSFDEITELIADGTLQKEELLTQRQSGFLRVYRNDGSETFVGEEARLEIKDLLEFRQKEIEESSQVKGTVASFPDKNVAILRGKAFVLSTAFGADEVIKNFQEGEILVATQTHPGIVPYMKNALSIVTDEGGITCHAAIVSRELHKPCIIGTRLGTKVFQTGDTLEVNLQDGTVKKI